MINVFLNCIDLIKIDVAINAKVLAMIALTPLATVGAYRRLEILRL